jgi:hypothetical protein
VCLASPEWEHAGTKQCLMWRDGDKICLRLLRRKNRSKGSGTLFRVCSCGERPSATCPVHVLWDRFLGTFPEGAEPWSSITSGGARDPLRRILALLHVPDAAKYRTQDLRRGHAEDMRRSGCSLAEILRAGQWKSTAFLKYLDEVIFFLNLSLLAHCVHS